jgi:hypothetical protein
MIKEKADRRSWESGPRISEFSYKNAAKVASGNFGVIRNRSCKILFRIKEKSKSVEKLIVKLRGYFVFKFASLTRQIDMTILTVV